MMDATYADFTGKAAQGRGKTVEEIDKVARGRVWSGTDALSVGLVDELGGFLKALDYTKVKLGLAPGDRVTLVEYQDSRETWLDFLKFFEDADVPDDIESFFRAALWMHETFGPLFGNVESRTQGPQLYMTPRAVH
jgi:protease-4